MDATFIVMWTGFILAGYAVVGNDSIQTLGTYLTSNEHRPWWVLWIFAGSILTATLVYGWYQYGGDVSYARLIGDPPEFSMDNPKYRSPGEKPDFGWPYLLPPLVLMLLTRTGIPVSTSFLILTFFKPKGLEAMMIKSVSGYFVAFFVAIALYYFITRTIEKKFITERMNPGNERLWTVLQWASTGFLWSQWLIQDFANIYVYLPRSISGLELFVSLSILLGMLALIFYQRGGAIQNIVRVKTNTDDVRSATIIDATFGVLLFIFKDLSNVPMSTTWVFLGLLAGREIAIRWRLQSVPNVVPYETTSVGVVTDADERERPLGLNRDVFKMVGMDLAKVTFGLIISIALVFIMRYLLNGSFGAPVG
jgi:hypothetical protein